MSGKPFDKLTADELKALEEREWTSEELTAAISMALEARDMEAVVALLHRLAITDPSKAQLILDFVTLTSAVERAAGE